MNTDQRNEFKERVCAALRAAGSSGEQDVRNELGARFCKLEYEVTDNQRYETLVDASVDREPCASRFKDSRKKAIA